MLCENCKSNPYRKNQLSDGVIDVEVKRAKKKMNALLMIKIGFINFASFIKRQIEQILLIGLVGTCVALLVFTIRSFEHFNPTFCYVEYSNGMGVPDYTVKASIPWSWDDTLFQLPIKDPISDRIKAQELSETQCK